MQLRLRLSRFTVLQKQYFWRTELGVIDTHDIQHKNKTPIKCFDETSPVKALLSIPPMGSIDPKHPRHSFTKKQSALALDMTFPIQLQSFPCSELRDNTASLTQLFADSHRGYGEQGPGQDITRMCFERASSHRVSTMAVYPMPIVDFMADCT